MHPTSQSAISKRSERRIIKISEMEFMRRTTGYIGLDYKYNFEIMKEVNT
jgi:glycine betaine/choline ABC-type transport system substrate-binding protein